MPSQVARSQNGLETSLLNSSLLLPASSYLIAFILLFAGVDKATHYSKFLRALASYAIVPAAIVRFIAFPVITMEIFIGIGLLVPTWRSNAAKWAAALLSIFTIAVATNAAMHKPAACGCIFTITLNKGSWTHILMNLGMIGLSCWIGITAKNEEKTETGQ